MGIERKQNKKSKAEGILEKWEGGPMESRKGSFGPGKATATTDKGVKRDILFNATVSGGEI